MKYKRIKAKAILKNVRLGYYEPAGFGLWWNMDIKGLGIMQNPIQADINFIRRMFELFEAKSLSGLQDKEIKVEYSYCPTFMIHKMSYKNKDEYIDEEFDIDAYLKKCNKINSILNKAGIR